MGTWSYYPTKLSTSAKDQVRLIIGDTVSTDQQMLDEEINFFLTQRRTVWGAAAECCRTLASKFARSVDQAAGNAKLALSQMSKAYTLKAFMFEERSLSLGGAVPYAGGISIADKIAQESDTDRFPPQFVIGMDQNLLPISPAGTETELQGGTPPFP